MNLVHFWYQFHAVGQGLFASGHLHEFESNRRFHWVFDCGTSSKSTYLTREVDRLTALLDEDPIGLFCLSHFDEDHISGARELLAKHRVNVLAMPYFPLVERMEIALATENISSEYLQFLIDPAGHMFEVGGENLEEIIFLRGGGPFGPADEEFGPPGPVGDPEEPWTLQPPNTEDREPPADEDIHGVSAKESWRPVRIHGHQQPFTVGGGWEFCFFNEHIPTEKGEELRALVAKTIRRNRNPNGRFKTSLLKQLQPLYDQTFGSTGAARNKISLVVYSGPVRHPAMLANLRFNILPVGFSGHSRPHRHSRFLRSIRFPKLSIGYFGDFPLTSKARLNNIRDFWGTGRWDSIQVIQVPHHGSSRSWFKGASGEFAHGASVFSSWRRAKYHPAQSVLDDLKFHCPMLANELQRVSFCGHLACT